MISNRIMSSRWVDEIVRYTHEGKAKAVLSGLTLAKLTLVAILIYIILYNILS